MIVINGAVSVASDHSRQSRASDEPGIFGVRWPHVLEVTDASSPSQWNCVGAGISIAELIVAGATSFSSISESTVSIAAGASSTRPRVKTCTVVR